MDTVGIVCDVLAILFASICIYFLFVQKGVGKATLAGTLFIATALIGNPERFQSFKFSLGGIETRARDVIQQAQVTIEQLRNLSATLSESSLDQLAFSGYIFMHMNDADKFRLRDEIVARMREIGVDEKTIFSAQRGWITLYCTIIEERIILKITKAASETDQSFLTAKAEIDTAAIKDGRNGIPSPVAMRNWVDRQSNDDHEVKVWLTAYESIWKTGGLTSPEMIKAIGQ